MNKLLPRLAPAIGLAGLVVLGTSTALTKAQVLGDVVFGVVIAVTVGLIGGFLSSCVRRTFSMHRRRQLQARMERAALTRGYSLDDRNGVGREASVEERRFMDYIKTQRNVAENELLRFLPDNPREAKRLINHQRLYTLIAEDRDVFGGQPELSYRHLSKWVVIVEHWPRLGVSLTSDPSRMAVLERCSDVASLQEAIDVVAPGIRAISELFQVLQEGVPLSPVLERLVRFESSSLGRLSP
jgi:hypothetical protein